MKIEDSLTYKLSLRTRLRLSQNFVDSSSKGSSQKSQLSKLYKRSSHIKKIIDKVLSQKNKIKKAQTKRLYNSMVKTRSRAKKDLEYHPFRQLVSMNVNPRAFKKFLKEAYEGAVYSAKHLQQIELQENIKQTVQIPQTSGQKILILDLDQTLIHSVEKEQNCEVVIPDIHGSSIRMNIRPYVRQFLKNMSQFYHIYIFTASTQSYAQPILNYLDPSSTLVKGLLCRQSCVLTSRGCYVKDLRIFSSSNLNNVIIIDNYVHSFGLQMQNGIPILPFQKNTSDKQLEHIQKMLLKIKGMDDVRPFLNKMFQLRKLGQMKKKDLNL